MEDKLEEYRLRKRRKENFEKIKEKFLKMVSFEGLMSKTKNEDVAVKMARIFSFKFISEMGESPLPFR